MPAFIDQTGHRIELDHIPRRIISVVPSQTELLFYLGLDNEVIGITKFCIHPTEWFRTKTRVGGTKTLNEDLIRHLSPDLIIANKEENVQEQIESLAIDLPVWTSDIHTLDEAYAMISEIGKMTGRENESSILVENIKNEFTQLKQPVKLLRAAYLIWQDPIMVAGVDTFITEMMKEAGFENVIKEKRYPECKIEQLKEFEPDVLLLSPEPYPFKEKHADEFRKQLPGVKILLVDGELFSWYGSRLLSAPSYFSSLQQAL